MSSAGILCAVNSHTHIIGGSEINRNQKKLKNKINYIGTKRNIFERKSIGMTRNPKGNQRIKRNSKGNQYIYIEESKGVIHIYVFKDINRIQRLFAGNRSRVYMYFSV